MLKIIKASLIVVMTILLAVALLGCDTKDSYVIEEWTVDSFTDDSVIFSDNNLFSSEFVEIKATHEEMELLEKGDKILIRFYDSGKTEIIFPWNGVDIMGQPIYSKVNPVQDAVLVCVDKEKDIYKYIPIKDIKFDDKTTLKEVITNLDNQITELKKDIIKLNKKFAATFDVVIDLAENKGEE